jgi:hypothetical protein
MPEKNRNEPTKETQPAKGELARIPIPTREDVFPDLGKIAKPRKQSPGRDAEEHLDDGGEDRL